MKVLICSDSHGDLSALLAAADRETPDRVFHLGDLLGDANRLSFARPNLIVSAVAGNCDGFSKGAQEIFMEVEGKKFFLTHGHGYQVKLGIGAVARAGQAMGADAVCFGHTHQALCTQYPNGMWLVNPGSIGGVGAPATYALAEWEGENLSIRLKDLN